MSQKTSEAGSLSLNFFVERGGAGTINLNAEEITGGEVSGDLARRIGWGGVALKNKTSEPPWTHSGRRDRSGRGPRPEIKILPLSVVSVSNVYHITTTQGITPIERGVWGGGGEEKGGDLGEKGGGGGGGGEEGGGWEKRGGKGGGGSRESAASSISRSSVFLDLYIDVSTRSGVLTDLRVYKAGKGKEERLQPFTRHVSSGISASCVSGGVAKKEHD